MTTNELLLNSISAFLRNEKLTAPQETDWQELIQKAEQQKLLPMLYEALSESMPENVRKVCKAAVIQAVTAQTRRTAEFLEVYEELTEAGIEPVTVKGLVCRSTYAKSYCRVSFDEDVYIPIESYPAFHEKMLSMGFAATEPDYGNAHEQRYTRNGLVIEGHWELFPKENDVLNALNEHNTELMKRAKSQSICGVNIKCLEPTDHMIFLLFHAYKHFVASGVGVRQICDIAQWSKCCEPDWSRVHSAMNAMHCECFAAAVFDAGEKYFGMSFPDDWERTDSTALLEDALNGGIYGTSDMSRSHSASMTLEAVEAASRGKNGAPLLKTLFPKRTVMEMNYPWLKKSAVLLPLAWGARIVRYLGEWGKGSTSSESLKIGAERIELLKQYKII